VEVDRVHDKAAEKNKIKEATTIRKGLPSSLTVRRARRFCLGFIIVTGQVKIVNWLQWTLAATAVFSCLFV
jgi:hypothetical protein